MLKKCAKLMGDPYRLLSMLVVNAKLRLQGNIHAKGVVSVNGFPIIDIQKGSRLSIGRNVTLNSRNRGYHVSLFAPVKLFADRQGATITIGSNTRIHGACIHAYESITIGANCLIAGNTQIIDGNGHNLSFPDVDNRIHTTGGAKPVHIEDSVWIGANCFILPGVRIGKGAVISANSVVKHDIPPMCLAGGNPAVVLKRFDGEGEPESLKTAA